MRRDHTVYAVRFGSLVKSPAKICGANSRIIQQMVVNVIQTPNCVKKAFFTRLLFLAPKL